MPTANELLFVIAVLLVIAIILLVALVRKRPDVGPIELRLNSDIEGILERVGRSVRHHADVSAVLELMAQIGEHPDAIERLQSYPETVRAAAWLHYINSLGSDLQHAQQHLSDLHQADISRFSYSQPKRQEMVGQAQNEVNRLRTNLNAAIAASGQKVGPRAV